MPGISALPLAGSLLYEQLGHKAFGMVGKLAASGSITMQNIGGKTRGEGFACGVAQCTRRECPMAHFALVMV